MIGANRRKSAGTYSTLAPESTRNRSGRTIEATAIVHVRVGEDRVQIGQQGTEHLKVDPVVPLAECVEERAGMGRPEPNGDRVGRSDESCGFGAAVDVPGGHSDDRILLP